MATTSSANDCKHPPNKDVAGNLGLVIPNGFASKSMKPQEHKRHKANNTLNVTTVSAAEDSQVPAACPGEVPFASC